MEVPPSGGGWTRVLDLILQRRRTCPADAKVAYHDTQDAAKDGEPGCFTLSLNHSLYFQMSPLPAIKSEPVEEAGPSLQVQQGHVGSAVPQHTWPTQFTDIVWTTKWTQTKGLVPVRPLVLLMQDLVLPPRAVESKRA